MKKQNEVNDLIRRVYKTAMDASEWDSLLSILMDSLKTTFAVHMKQHVTTGQGKAFQVIGLDNSGVESYEEYYGPRSVSFRDIALYSQDNVYTDHLSENYREYIASETYHDFCCKYQAERLMTLVTGKNDNWMGLVVLRRSEKVGAYTQHEIDVGRLLASHMEQASHLAHKLGGKNLLTKSFEAAFDKLSLGVVVISKPNRVVFMNNAANQIFSRNDGLSGMGGQLNAINPEDNRSLQSNLQRMFQIAIANGVDFSKPLSIKRNTQSFPYRVSLTPLIREVLAVHDSHNLVLAMIHDPDQPLEESFQVVQAVHGLTKRETLLARYLCRGFDVAQMADVTNTSINTVRTHMKSVLRKTGTNSQAQLVAKIYSNFGLNLPVLP